MAPPPLTGTLLGGRYRVGELLGEGGMGTVYAAVQEGLDRRVALKVMHPHLSHDSELRERFQREAHVVATLGHPNVVQISDFQTNEDEPPFLVMELLHGENLRDVLKRTPRLAPSRVAYIASQVLSALEAAHRANIVHRDIKPDNIFLERTSVQADIVKVLDFGVAKLIGENHTSPQLTRSGLVVGTLAYMAPEQATGDPIDGRADLYSLAAVMYVALVGKKPFEGVSTSELVQAIMTATPVSVSTLRPEVDAELSRIVDRGLTKRAADRFADASEMARALKPFAKPTPLDDPTSTLPSTPVMTVRTPATAMEPHAPPATAPLPKTITMDAMPESIAPRTTPVPPPTKRSSYHPANPATLAQAPIDASRHASPKKHRSMAPLLISIAVASVILLAAGGTLLAVFRPWEARAAAPAASAASVKK